MKTPMSLYSRAFLATTKEVSDVEQNFHLQLSYTNVYCNALMKRPTAAVWIWMFKPAQVMLMVDQAVLDFRLAVEICNHKTCTKMVEQYTCLL